MFLLVVLFVLGLCFGSFATMASYRLVVRKSLLNRSFCPKCKHKLGVLDLFPVLSYIFQRGKCRYCKAHISMRYPLIELSTALLFVLVGYEYSYDLITIVLLCSFVVCMVIMTVTDLEHYIIPDEIQFAFAIIGIFYAYYYEYTLAQVLLMPLFMLIVALGLKHGCLLFLKKDGLGYGDVKFFAVAGLYLNVEMVSSFLLLSGLMGLVLALVWRVLGRGELFPFGPALALSLFLCQMYPELNVIARILNS